MVPHERQLRASEPRMLVLDPPDPDNGALACRPPETGSRLPGQGATPPRLGKVHRDLDGEPDAQTLSFRLIDGSARQSVFARIGSEAHCLGDERRMREEIPMKRKFEAVG
jgi:hypothetical protein